MQHTEIEEGGARWPLRIAGLVVVMVVAAAVAFLVHMKLAGGSEDSSSYQPYAVGTMTMRAAVTSSGVAVSQDEAILSFAKPGQLAEILVNLGDEVKEGQPLMRTKSDDLQNAAATAQSMLALAELQLQEMEEGATDTELAKADGAVVAAESALTKAQNDLSDALDPATDARMTAAQQAVAAAEANLAAAEAKLDTLENGASDAEIAAAEAKVSQAETTVTQAKRAQTGAESNEANAQDAFETAGTRYCDLDEALADICNDLEVSHYEDPLTDSQIDSLWNSLEAGPTPTPTPTSDLESAVVALAYANTNYKNAISLADSAEENIEIAEYSLTAAEAALDELEDGASQEDIDAAEQAVAAAEAGYTAAASALRELIDGATDTTIADLTVAVYKAEADLRAAQTARDEVAEGATSTQLAIQRERVHSAQLQLQQANIALKDSTLVSPFDGVVSSLPVKIGQVLNASIPAVTVLTPGELIFELNVGETELPAIKVGQKGGLRFDAIQEKAFGLEIFAVGLSPESQQGVIIYKVKCKIEGDVNDPAGKNPAPGMNGSASITTEQRPNVVAIPTALVRSRGGEKVVEVVSDGKIELRTVTVGLSDGDNTEILTGLAVGDTLADRREAASATEKKEEKLPGGVR